MIQVHSNLYLTTGSIARDYLGIAVSHARATRYDASFDSACRALSWANVKGDRQARATALRFMSWLRSGGFV